MEFVFTVMGKSMIFIYYSPITNKTFPVPRHNTEVAGGTLKSILKDAGLK
ncbi:type II toxin-antitoxin system HicA family toxin [Sporanaerobacter sp. PP17-6a]